MIICSKPPHTVTPAPRAENSIVVEAVSRGPVFLPRRRLSPFAEKMLERSRAAGERRAARLNV